MEEQSPEQPEQVLPSSSGRRFIQYPQQFPSGESFIQGPQQDRYPPSWGSFIQDPQQFPSPDPQQFPFVYSYYGGSFIQDPNPPSYEESRRRCQEYFANKHREYLDVYRPALFYRDTGCGSNEEYRAKRAKEYAEFVLTHYNSTTKGPKYELVESFGANDFPDFPKFPVHVCFLAKPILSSADVNADTDTSPKHFFGEILSPIGKDESVNCCVIVDPHSPYTTDGCGLCPPNCKQYHPTNVILEGSIDFVDWSAPLPSKWPDVYS